MRETLFRGKTADENEWIYGDIFHSGAYPEITRIHDYVNHLNYAVNPETVGEFTGLTDKNGVKIFEGDFIKVQHELGFVRFGEYKDIEGRYHLGFYIRWETDLLRPDIIYWAKNEKIKVAGNAYDNPELVGGDDHATD